MDYAACRVRAAAMFVRELLPRKYARLLARDRPALRLRHLQPGRHGVFELRRGKPPTLAFDVTYIQRATDAEVLELVAHECWHYLNWASGKAFVSMEHEHRRVARQMKMLGLPSR